MSPRDAWFDALDIDGKRLSATERLQIDFIFAGLVSALGSSEVEQSPLVMPTLADSPIGKAAIATLEEIATAQRERSTEAHALRETARAGSHPA